MAYENFFGLKEAPFRLTPDPEYYFPSDVHKEALQTLLYSIRAGEGFVQITGEPGTGKTLILRTILQQLGDEVTTALILNPRLSPQELLRVILEDLGIDPLQMEQKPKEALLRSFRDFLLDKARKGKKTVVIIDEAQNLPHDTMEELRLLSNLETEKEKLLQIILVGQIELEEKLKGPHLKQLNQRITIRYRLKPLSEKDTISYIYHRIRIAGGSDHIRFTPVVLARIYQLSKGVPRLINIICERALMAAYVVGQNTIGKDQIKKAMESIVGEPEIKQMRPFLRPVPILIVVLVLIIAALGWKYQFLAFPNLKPSNQPLLIGESEKSALVNKEADLREKELSISQKAENLSQKEAELSQKEAVLSKEEAVIGEKHEELSQKEKLLSQKETNLTQKETVLSKKEEGLAQKEEVLGKKEELLVKKQTVSSPQETLLASAKPVFPPEAFYVPPGNFFLAVNQDEGKAYLWQGSAQGPMLKEEFAWEWNFTKGLYVLGKDAQKGKFIFNHITFFWDHPNVIAEKIWEKVGRLVAADAVPLIVYSSKGKVDPALIEKAQGVKDIIKSWANSWMAMDIDRYLNFYGRVFTNYYLDYHKPIAYSWDELYQLKRKIFLKSGYISLKISDPICFIDPSNPRMVMVVFNQKYNSKVYQDEGGKALYLSLVDGPGGEKDWKMVGKLWLPH